MVVDLAAARNRRRAGRQAAAAHQALDYLDAIGWCCCWTMPRRHVRGARWRPTRGGAS